MIPKNYEQAMDIIKKFCGRCCGRKKSIHKEDCKDDACPFIDIAKAPRQLTFFDASYRQAFYLAAVELVPEMPEHFTLHQLKTLYHERVKNGAADPHWWGMLSKRNDFKALVIAIDRIRSKNKRSKGNTTILWKKREPQCSQLKSKLDELREMAHRMHEEFADNQPHDSLQEIINS